MAKFLNTSATTYHLEEIIKNANERIILISPYLKLNDRIQELISDKNILKVDIKIIYGKNELHPAEINWLNELQFVRTSFCKNLHAKCYMNELQCIITSMNLYEFSQQNNNEMGILLDKAQDTAIYKDAYEEAQRIIRISEEVRISLERVDNTNSLQDDDETLGKLSSSKIAQKHKMKTAEFIEKMVSKGYLESINGKIQLTESGKNIGGNLNSAQGMDHTLFGLKALPFKRNFEYAIKTLIQLQA